MTDLQKKYTQLKSIDESDTSALLSKALELFQPKIALACSFSFEDVALIHVLAKINPQVKIFALDTWRLNDETLTVAKEIEAKYQLKIDWITPNKDTVKKLEAEKGLFSFRESIENRQECCGIRKVEPLTRALHGLDAWISGQRRAQSVTRKDLAVVELDSAKQLVKLNPLADWSFEKVKTYVVSNSIPYNALYDRGFTSIGCAPCTRAIEKGESERSGRWWWERSEDQKECGIHLGGPKIK